MDSVTDSNVASRVFVHSFKTHNNLTFGFEMPLEIKTDEKLMIHEQYMCKFMHAFESAH